MVSLNKKKVKSEVQKYETLALSEGRSLHQYKYSKVRL